VAALQEPQPRRQPALLAFGRTPMSLTGPLLATMTGSSSPPEPGWANTLSGAGCAAHPQTVRDPTPARNRPILIIVPPSVSWYGRAGEPTLGSRASTHFFPPLNPETAFLEMSWRKTRRVDEHATLNFADAADPPGSPVCMSPVFPGGVGNPVATCTTSPERSTKKRPTLSDRNWRTLNARGA